MREERYQDLGAQYHVLPAEDPLRVEHPARSRRCAEPRRSRSGVDWSWWASWVPGSVLPAALNWVSRQAVARSCVARVRSPERTPYSDSRTASSSPSMSSSTAWVSESTSCGMTRFLSSLLTRSARRSRKCS
jgi:hypothetical protein